MKGNGARLAQAKTILAQAREADAQGLNPQMRARNHDEILSWIENDEVTWQELEITADDFEVLLLRMINRCEECTTNTSFLNWIVSDLKSRCYAVKHKISRQGSAMATVVDFRNVA
jgi:hypothetical protein